MSAPDLFGSVAIGWKGVTYPVPPDRYMGLLAVIEEALAPGGRGDIVGMLANPYAAHLTRFARAYSGALRYAGCEVTDLEVYRSMQAEVVRGNMESQASLIGIANGLFALMFPASAETGDSDSDGDKTGDGEPVGNVPGAATTAPDGGTEKA